MTAVNLIAKTEKKYLMDFYKLCEEVINTHTDLMISSTNEFKCNSKMRFQSLPFHPIRH